MSEHDGELRAFSAGEGRGSCFSVQLPRVVDSEPRLPSESSLRSPELRAARVLVVDDNEDATEMLSALFEHLGHDTRVAGDSARALELAQAFEPEIIISDIGMPGMDGHELVRRLRQLPSCAMIPIIALSGYSDTTDRQKALQAGFTEHFSKPLDFERLAQVLESVRTGSSRI